MKTETQKAEEIRESNEYYKPVKSPFTKIRIDPVLDGKFPLFL